MPTNRRRARSRSHPGLTVGVFGAVFAVYLLTASAGPVNTDAAANSLTAWRIAHTGRPWMEGLDLEESGQIPHFGAGRDGHTVTGRTPGQIWAAVPFYLGSEADQESFSLRRGGLAAATLSALAVLCVYLSVRTHVRPSHALGGSLVLAFATPIWTVGADALWTHSVTVLAITGAGLALSRDRAGAAGAALAGGILARPHLAIISAVVGIATGLRKRSVRPVLQVAVWSLLAIGVLSCWNRYVFGSWDPRGAYTNPIGTVVPGVGTGLADYARNAAGFLVSADRGLLVWTPLAVLLLPAVIRSWRTTPSWTRTLAGSGLVYTAVQLGLNDFDGGDGFYGYRLGLELLASLAPLYICSLSGLGRPARLLAPAVVGLQLAAMAVGSVWFSPVPRTEVWSRNSLLVAVGEDPAILSTALALAVLAATAVALVRRVSSGAEPVRDADTG